MKNSGSNAAFVAVAILVVLLGLIVYRTLHSGGRNALPSNGNAAAIRVGPPDIYPDSSRTPGESNPAITQDNIDQTICNPRWSTRSVRPPASYTNRLKFQQLRDFGDTDLNPRDYEEDHLIPLEIGGNPRDSRNLWPEPYDTSVPDGGARSKDKVESYLREQVCAGNITLAEAQMEIATDWYRVYVTSVEGRR